MFLATIGEPPHAVVQTFITKVDSAHVFVAPDSLHPQLVRLVLEHKGTLERILTSPGFNVAWPFIPSIVAFFFGRWWEARDDARHKRDAQWTSARLARRYLRLSAKQIRVLVDRATDTNKILAAAHVDFVQRAVSDFGDIKTRMIVLEDDELEDKIFQWNLVCLDNLKEMVDRLAMDPNEYVRTHGVQTVQLARDAALTAALSTDADSADDIVKLLAPYVALKKSASAPDAL